MPVREHVTQQEMRLALAPTVIGSDTTTDGTIFDTANFDLGIYFAFMLSAYTDGTFTLKLQHGDNSGLSDAADVPSNMLVYGTLPALSAATAAGAMLPREGVHSTKRYVRASLVSTSVTTGATATMFIVKDAENVKTDQT
jgi:precorrin-4 methylase